MDNKWGKVDERAKKLLKTIAPVKEFAVGEATYTGGEVPALAIVDAITRRLPGVLGKDASVEERRVASSAVYIRPETLIYKKKKYRVLLRVVGMKHNARVNLKINEPAGGKREQEFKSVDQVVDELG